MPSSVVDALVVTLGLDAAKFKAGTKEADTTLSKISSRAVKTDKDMQAWGKNAGLSLSKLRNEALSLLGIFTAGLGITAFAKNTIVAGAQLGRMSDNLGISTQKLSAYGLAARLAGASSGAMASQLKANQLQVAGARLGMYAGTTRAAFQFGLKQSDLKNSETLLRAQARIIHHFYKTDPGRARFVAGLIGVQDGAFNFMKQGPKAMDAQVEAAKKLSKWTHQDALNAITLNNRFIILEKTFGFTGSRILFALLPSITKIAAGLQKIADWILAHKDDINRWVSKAVHWVGELIDKVKQGSGVFAYWKEILGFIVGLKILSAVSPLIALAGALGSVGLSLGVIASIGGAALAVFLGLKAAKWAGLPDTDIKKGNEDLKNGNMLGASVHLPAMQFLGALKDKMSGTLTSARAKQVWAFLTTHGWTSAQAAGIMGSFAQEDAGFNPATVNASGHQGIGQWGPKRAALFKKMFGHSVSQGTLEEQLQFFQWETTHGEARAGAKIHAATSVADAARAHADYYERPGDAEKNNDRRVRLGDEYYGSMGGSRVASGMVLPVNTIGRSNASSTTTVNVGTVTINTKATDAKGVADAFAGHLQSHILAAQANTGLE